jgi:dTMP kinase
MTETSKGKLIVLDGTDGSGKGTQAALLIAQLVGEGYRAELFDFPRYDEPSAFFVAKYLRGEYGSADYVGAYRASLFYALDRYDASFLLREKLRDGVIVVSNRYVSSNMGHQAGKIADTKERERFMEWLKDLEYRMLGIPTPDITFLLSVPPSIGQQFVDKKETRAYTKGMKRDIHEADLAHLSRAWNVYREVAMREGWTVIDCMNVDGTTLREKGVISEEIRGVLHSSGVVPLLS